jgi:hypothetical protein
MKLVDKKKEKILNEELNKLLTVLPLMKFEDKRRITVLNQI